MPPDWPALHCPLTPLDLPTLLLLSIAGWEFDDILRVFANRINGVPNAPTSADSTPEGVPGLKDFLSVVEYLDEIQDLGGVVLAAGESEDEQEIIVRFLAEVRQTDYFGEFVRLLDLDPDAEVYRIRIGHTQSTPEEIVIETRAIAYRGYWYYVEAGDIDSIETLTMLSIVLTLKAGGAPSDPPVLTLPVGGV